MHPRAQQMFEELCDLPKEDRDARLDDLNITDAVLADEVRSLLSSYADCGDFLADATVGFEQNDDDPDFVAIGEKAGDTIGRYKLLEQIGEGGFGQVFMAQQTEPVRRRVALKIIKLGMDTGQALARFEAERQALAIMDHPNIARVFDGGATETGRPYFVMELVRGEPITDYCDRGKMPLSERLQLFRQVCQAVEHAHQKGIVHRDIKPSNVLVTVSDDAPLVKVIDFGIAKALNVELTEKTLFTEFRQLIGTPQYMSPEQAERSGVDIDTRSDIYSLGVLLYEILTGATPVDPKRMQSAAWGQWQKMISEEEPSRPSDHVSTSLDTLTDVASHRSVPAKDLAGALRGDLDWIVLKSLEKDRSRRYSTATQFADDIERYLTDQVVLATPPDKWYLFTRFLRRHRKSVLFGGLLLATLLVGLIATAMTASWALRERAKAMAAEGVARQGERQVRRFADRAALAGSPLLSQNESQRLASEWREDIEAMRTKVGSDHPDLVSFECQYQTWSAYQALRRNDRSAMQSFLVAADELVPRATCVLADADTNLLSLLNAAIQMKVTLGKPPSETVDLYGQLIPLMKNIHGPEAARSMLPEYAMKLAQANRHQLTETTIRDYLEQMQGKTAKGADFIRLNVAVDELANWGASHQQIYDRLRAFRDVGIVTSETNYDDVELDKDQKAMQGIWQEIEDNGNEIIMGELRIRGDRGDVVKLNAKGEAVWSGSARLQLSRSGACKLLKMYLNGSPSTNGQTMIYSVHEDTMNVVHGMAAQSLGKGEPKLVVWRKISAVQSKTFKPKAGTKPPGGA